MPIERIPIYIRGLDLVSESGVSAMLRPRPEVLIADTLDNRVAVAVAVADAVDDSALGLVRELNARGARHVLLIVTSIDDTGLLTAIAAGVCGVVSRAEATPECL